MNVQAILFTLILAVGLILIIISSQESSLATNQQRMSQTTIYICRYVGIVIGVIGLSGLVFTFGEIIYRQLKNHRHLACECHASKWEQHAVKNYATSISKVEAGKKELKVVKVEAPKTSMSDIPKKKSTVLEPTKSFKNSQLEAKNSVKVTKLEF